MPNQTGGAGPGARGGLDSRLIEFLGLNAARKRGVRQFGMVWAATALLMIVAAFIAPSAVTGTSLLSMLPFASVLAIVAVGETLVIQQRGLDFSVGGAISLTIVFMTKFPQGHTLFLTIVVALAVLALAGFLSGIAVVVFNMPSLVATLGMNAILGGVAQWYSGGTVTAATPDLNSFMTSRALGIPTPAWIALAVIAVVSFAVGRTTSGRKFVAIGANVEAVRVSGARTMWNQVGTYVFAAMCYGVAGIIYTGYLDTPAVNGGDQYLLSGVSAVVIGGTALTGGRGSIVATAVAAFFLQQLSQVVFALGASASTQYIVDALAIAAAMVLKPLIGGDALNGVRRTSAAMLSRRARRVAMRS